MVMMRKSRASGMPDGGCPLLFFFAGAAVSRVPTSAKATPQARQISPGTTKAMRQPVYLTRKPVSTAAKATPRLPTRPLTPMVQPGRGAPCTSMGMPTGW